MQIKKQSAKQYKRSQITALKYTLLRTARKLTPKDTGNLRNNATYISKTNYGFKLVIDSTFAHYVKYVNEPSRERLMKSPKVAKNAYYVDRIVNDCIGIIKGMEIYWDTPLSKKKTRLQPLYTSSAFQEKVLNDTLKGNVIDGFGTYYKMNKRLQRSVLKAYDEEELDIDYDMVDDFEESGD